MWDKEEGFVLEGRKSRGTKTGVRVEKEYEYRTYRLIL